MEGTDRQKVRTFISVFCHFFHYVEERIATLQAQQTGLSVPVLARSLCGIHYCRFVFSLQQPTVNDLYIKYIISLAFAFFSRQMSLSLDPTESGRATCSQ